MFDYFHSSFDLGEEFTNVELHTKDIEHGYGGTMSKYWLDPHGYLYLIDYARTQDMKVYEPGDPEYREDHKWLNFRWVPNGNHGKIRPWMITKYVSVYPSRWDGQFEDWPTCKIHFKYGRLVDYEIMTRNEGV